VKTQFGYHVIQALSSVKPKKTQPLSQVRETIRQQLLQQKRSESMTAWAEEVKKEFEDKVVYATGFEPPELPATTTG
jgi:parvulin-like peptidyl-prolyl isomerase